MDSVSIHREARRMRARLLSCLLRNFVASLVERRPGRGKQIACGELAVGG